MEIWKDIYPGYQIPNPENKREVNHINEIKTDNRAENLEWCTHTENIRHAFATGLAARCLTAEQVRYIRQNPDDLNTYELAEKFGVVSTTISDIQPGKIYKTAGGSVRESKTQLVPDEVRAQIRAEYQPGVPGCGYVSLAKKFGVSTATVWRIVNENQSSSKPANSTLTFDGSATS